MYKRKRFAIVEGQLLVAEEELCSLQLFGY